MQTNYIQITFNSLSLSLPTANVIAGSPSRDGDVAVYVFDINQPSFPTSFYSVFVSVSVIVALSTVFRSAFSLCCSGLIPVLLVFSYISLRKSSLALL